MTTQPFHHHGPAIIDRASEASARAERYVAPLGRTLFALIFLAAAPNHFAQKSIQMAAAHGVPVPGVLVPAAGILSLIGSISILVGFKARLGAWLIVLFLIPVTIMMHNFWAVADLEAHQIQMIMFMKNVSILGGALLIAAFGAGPFSLDARTKV